MTANNTRTLVCLLTISIAAIAISGCATTKQDWQEAHRQGTIEAYELFLQNHPEGEQADEAKRLLPILRENKAWSEVQATNTIDAYEGFLNDYPQSEQREQASAAIEGLRFGQAQETDSIEAYQSYLQDYPEGTAAQDAAKRIRELRYDDAKQQKTIQAFESFLALYSEGEDADAIRIRLAAARVLEKTLLFGKRIMKHAPQTFIKESLTVGGLSIADKRTGSTVVDRSTSHGELVTERRDPDDEDLRSLREMLAEGADPNVVGIAGFEPASEIELRSGVLLSTGKPGRAVKAEEGDIALLEYCRVNGLEAIVELLMEYGAE